MEGLTKELAIKLHRDMWNYVADTIEKCEEVVDIDEVKSDFCCSNGFDVLYNCFLCEYDGDFCRNCPVMWGDSTWDRCTNLINGGLGLYHQARFAETWEEQARLAQRIANLPEREV